MHTFRYFAFLILVLSLQSCCWLTGDCEDTPDTPTVILPDFQETPLVSPLSVNHLVEVSGVVPAFRFQGHIWAMEDSGNGAGIDLINNNGAHIKRVNFNGTNRDWEGIAAGPGPETGKNYIYIGEIGDNLARYEDYFIFRFEEPQENQNTIEQYETIRFRYPNNEKYDAEALILDPKTKDLYVITKAQLNVRVYKLPYPQSTSSLNIADFLGTIKFSGVVAGDISVAGDELLLKTYMAIYYWKIREGETVYQTLSRAVDRYCPYYIEPQGEAVCWDLEAKGYFTLSEQGSVPQTPPLYYYSKK